MEQWSPSNILAVLGGISAMVVAIITAWRTGNKVDTVSAKTDTIIRKTENVNTVMDTVEKNTNNRATEQDKKIELLLAKVEALNKHIAEQEQARALLASEARPEHGNIIKP